MSFDDFWWKVSVIIGEANVKESEEENLPGIIFDETLSFTQHVKTLCKKASQKRHSLARISCYMDTEKLKQLIQAFRLISFYLTLGEFRKGYSTQHTILSLLQRCNSSIDNNGLEGTFSGSWKSS